MAAGLLDFRANRDPIKHSVSDFQISNFIITASEKNLTNHTLSNIAIKAQKI